MVPGAATKAAPEEGLERRRGIGLVANYKTNPISVAERVGDLASAHLIVEPYFAVFLFAVLGYGIGIGPLEG